MNRVASVCSRTAFILFVTMILGSMFGIDRIRAEGADGWIALFDGRSLAGWKASENTGAWQVQDGCLVACGERSHLFYDGPIANHDFRNFDLEMQVRTKPRANSGVYFHTNFQPSGWPEQGYEVQINNSYTGTGNYRELKKSGSLYGVRNTYKSNVLDGEWFRLRIRVVQNRVCVWLNEVPTVDYLQPDRPYRSIGQSGRLLSHGTIALQAHDPASHVAFRELKIRLLPDDADPLDLPRASDQGYGLQPHLIDRFAGMNVPVIDYHIHLRGGMTVDKAVARQAVTGIQSGVLRNIGKGWPIETDDQLREYLDDMVGKPVFAGLQVNDRDWMDKHAPELLERVDFVLGDTMIMPMPSDDDEPVKLWVTDQYTIDEPEAWMERYVRHNLRVLAEPITILANPTYLPPPLDQRYDELWTDERMRQVIEAAVANHVALEINADSGLPSDRFIRLAKDLGAKFTFGSNNFDDRPISMIRCFQAIDRYGLTKADMYVPRGMDR